MNIPQTHSTLSAKLAPRLLAERRDLLQEIHRYLQRHTRVPADTKQGLRKLESIILQDIRHLEEEDPAPAHPRRF